MADGRVTQAAMLCQFLLAQAGFLPEELDTKSDVFQKLRFVRCVTFFRVYDGHSFAKTS